MTNQEIIAVVQAAEAGKKIEARAIGSHDGGWSVVSPSPRWCFDIVEYRVKSEPREFYAIEYPPMGPVGGRLYASLESAKAFTPALKVIKLREVLE